MFKPILLVNDSSVDSYFTLRALRECKVVNHVLLAVSGDEAIATLESRAEGKNDGCIGLILLNVELPKIDGFEVLKLIKSRPALKDIPVIMLSRSLIKNDRARAQILGANGFVTKVAELDEFGDLLCKAIEPYKMALTSIA